MKNLFIGLATIFGLATVVAWWSIPVTIIVSAVSGILGGTASVFSVVGQAMFDGGIMFLIALGLWALTAVFAVATERK